MTKSDTPATEVVHPQDSPIIAVNRVLDSWWAETEADEVDGHDLLKDEALMELVGVPFMGFKVQYRDGVQRKDVPYRDDYASLEVQVAPWSIIDAMSARIRTRRAANKVPEGIGLASANEQLVVNDGSTGLYRQITEYLAAKEIIRLPEGPTEGEKGESVLDLPRSQWLEGAEAASKGIDIALRCSRGLRFSEYESPYLPPGETARTWYIA